MFLLSSGCKSTALHVYTETKGVDTLSETLEPVETVEHFRIW
jgi:hypothetical protein